MRPTSEASLLHELPADHLLSWTGSVDSIEVEDPQQLNGFAETSNAFKDRKQVTQEELNAKEAKGTNIYGEKLENPQAAVSYLPPPDHQLSPVSAEPCVC